MMIKCPFCQVSYVANTVFCSECGQYLLDDQKRETDPLNGDKGWVGQAVDKPSTGPLPQLNARQIAVHFKIGPHRREVELPLNKVIHLGRIDPTLDVFPDVDLSYDTASSKSVSRRHAAISRQGDTVIVEDIGSVNGSFINGRRLDPYLPEILNNGDILQLGKILIEVEIRRR
jgi:hypothetical protein